MGLDVQVYFVIHTVLFLCIFLDFLRVKKTVRDKVLIFVVVFITLFGGLRWQTGTDWYQYYYHFMHSDLANLFTQRKDGTGRFLEPGFVFVNASIKYIFGTFWMYNLITTGIIQFIRYKICKKLCGEYALTAYCAMMILSTNYFSIRAGFGMGVALASFYFIWRRQFKGFLITNVSSYLIHVQGIVMFPFYWIGHIKLNWKIFMIILLSMSSLAYFFQSQFTALASAFDGTSAGSLAMHYAENVETVSDGSRVRGLSTILMSTVYAVLFLYVRKKKHLEKDFWYNCLLNMFLVQTGIYIVFSNGMSDICRIAGMLIFAKVLLMIESVKYFREFGKKWEYYGILIFYAVYLISKIKGLDHGAFFYLCNVPYKTIFDYNLL